jgi:hypothetical protein
MVISAPGYETYTQFTAYAGAIDTKHIIGLTPALKLRQTIDGELLLAVSADKGSSSKLLKL